MTKTVSTGGPIRGLVGRWLMRFEASAQIFSVTFLGVTASSTLTSALTDLGYSHLAPYLLAAGCAVSPVIAYGYVEWGFFNRKNREGSDRGQNFSTPRDKIDDTLIGAAVFGAVHGRPPTEDELEAIEAAVDKPWQAFRDGADLDGVEA